MNSESGDRPIEFIPFTCCVAAGQEGATQRCQQSQPAWVHCPRTHWLVIFPVFIDSLSMKCGKGVDFAGLRFKSGQPCLSIRDCKKKYF